jgi:hypothetical protein
MNRKNSQTPVVLLAFFIVAASFSNTVLAQGQPIGKVTTLTGAVEVRHQGETEWAALKLNDSISFMDTVRTQENSRTQILMEDDSLLNLGEGAELTIREHIYQPDRDRRSSLFSLASGKIRVLVGKVFASEDSSFGVETPTSVIGIRLTQFIVWVASPELTTVVTLDGEVLAKNIRPDLICEEIVAKNYSSQIARDACPTLPEQLPAEEMERILLDTDVRPAPPGGDLPLASQGVQNAIADGLGEDVETLETAVEGEPVPATQPIDQQFGTTTEDEVDALEGEAPGATTTARIRPPGELPEPPRPPSRFFQRRIFRK